MVDVDQVSKLLLEGEEWLRNGNYSKAEECFRRVQFSSEPDYLIRSSIGLAEAILNDKPDLERIKEVYQLLICTFFQAKVTKQKAVRKRVLDLFCTNDAVRAYDHELIDLIQKRELINPSSNIAMSLLKAFFFSGACHDYTLGEKVEVKRHDLERRLRDRGTLTYTSYTLQFAKSFSSSTPLQDLSEDRSGGGYFLALGKYGCVIDPGHHFLENFYALPRTLADIDCIIVTHFHDDHYANLPALMSLLFQRWKTNGRQVRYLLDEQTYKVFNPLVNPKKSKTASENSGVLRSSQKKPLIINENIELYPLPTEHDVFGENSGVGLYFYIPQKENHLVITGDTGWTERVAEAYQTFSDKTNVTLVAHVSSARPKEEIIMTLTTGKDGFYNKHLCIHGLCKLIETVHPNYLILSEIGEELHGVTESLISMIKHYYGHQMEIRLGNTKNNPFYFD